MNLTDRFVQSAKAKDNQRTDYPDDKRKGLVLRVSPGGAKSWSLRYRRKSDGKLRRVTIGEYPAFTLSEARAAANEIIAAVSRGDDPAKTSKRPSPTKPRTFGELAQRYLEGYAVHKRTGREDEQMLRNDVLPVLEGELLGSIDRSEITAILDNIIARGSPVRANRTFAVIRKCFNWGLEKGYIDNTPILRMKPPSKEASRERILSEEEIRLFWRRIVDKAPMRWQMRALLKLCLVTGQRVSEIAGITRSELNFDNSEWIIPGTRAKNGVPHLVPLPPLALLILKKAELRSTHEALLLPSARGLVYGKSRPAQTMERCADVFGFREPVTPHDLRRTLGSGLGQLGYSRLIQDKVLNHITERRKISAVYDRYSYIKEKREALEAWADYLQSILFNKPRAVAAFQKQARPSASPWSIS